MGVVYYANYLVWFEIGRTELLRSAGRTYREFEALGLFLPVSRAECRYRKPAKYDEVVSIFTSVSEITRVRIVFHYRIQNHDTGELLAEGESPVFIQIMLMRQAELLWNYVCGGKRTQAELGVQPMAFREIQRQARGWTPRALARVIRRLAWLDQRLKSEPASVAGLRLELVMLAIARLLARRP